MRKITFLCHLYLVLVVTSCSPQGEQINAYLQAQNDSLQRAIAVQERELTDMQSYLSIVRESLDSIAVQEGVIIFNDLEKKQMTKKQLKQRLDDFASILNRQRERISVLEDELEESQGMNTKKLRDIINYLNAQLEEKNRTIAELQQEVEKKNSDIRALIRRVEVLTESNKNLALLNERQREAIEIQGAILNECYVRVGRQKDLQKAGILTFNVPPKLNIENFRPELFTAIDIRECPEIPIPGKNPQILTERPKESYRMIVEGNETILSITNPNQFWSVSNYLVIVIR